mmetsp:Transcript_9743/g.33625  ORF Transcript_9743/g.33625 Transcript_9743/m.33625 type:complete len:208 (+) Transcript_9743:1843-2466(+)
MTQVKHRGGHPVACAMNSMDQANHSGSRLGVTHIGLACLHTQRCTITHISRSGLHQHSMSCTNLNGVPKRSTRTMHVENGHRRTRQGSPLHRTGYDLLLCWTVWCRQGRRPAILIHSRSCKAHNRTSKLSRLAFAVQQQNATSFSTHITISISIKCLAPAINSKHACLLEHNTCVRSQGQVHTTRKRHCALTQQHAITCHVGSHQRG